MKSAIVVTAAALGASATTLIQTPPLTTSAPAISTKYEYYDDCTTDTGYETTATDTIVHQYCPDCEEGHGGTSYTTKARTLTTYTTVYSQFCSTGLEEKTFTITESCTSENQPRSSGYVPSGFTVTTATCHVCGETPVTATLTCPTPIAPTAGPGGTPATVPAVATGSSSISGSVPTPGGAGPPTGIVPSSETSGPPTSGEYTPPGGVAPPAGAASPAGVAPPADSSPAGAASPASGESAPPAGTAAPATGESTPAAATAPAGVAPPTSGESAPPAGNAPPPAGGLPSAAIVPTPEGSNGGSPPPGESGSVGPSAPPVLPFTGVASRLCFDTSMVAGLLGMAVFVYGL